MQMQEVPNPNLLLLMIARCLHLAIFMYINVSSSLEGVQNVQEQRKIYLN